MAVTSREIRAPRAPQSDRPISVPSGVASNPYILAIVGLLVAVALYALIGAGVRYGRVALDDVRYGRPRTTHLAVQLGHNDSAERPSELMAINLNRQIVLVEFSGGDPQAVHTITGPYLFGAGEDLTPVQLSAADVNGDQLTDVILNVRNEQVIFLNRGAALEPATPDELAKIGGQSRP